MKILSFSISQNFHSPVNLNKQYSCFKLVHFSKRMSRVLSVAIPRRTFNRSWIAFYTRPVHLKYEDSKDIKEDSVDAVIIVTKRKVF